jgi:hypothetical protein
MFVVYAWPLQPLLCSAIGLLVGLTIKKDEEAMETILKLPSAIRGAKLC